MMHDKPLYKTNYMVFAVELRLTNNLECVLIFTVYFEGSMNCNLLIFKVNFYLFISEVYIQVHAILIIL